MARFLDGAGFQRMVYLHALVPQGTGGNNLPAHDALHCQRQPGGNLPAQPQDAPGHQEADGGGKNPDQPTSDPFAPLGFGQHTAEKFFQKGNQLPDEDNRMGQPVGITQAAVNQKADENG